MDVVAVNKILRLSKTSAITLQCFSHMYIGAPLSNLCIVKQSTDTNHT